MNASSPEYENIEELLADAGIDFTVVDRCPYAACEVCRDKGLPAAA